MRLKLFYLSIPLVVCGSVFAHERYDTKNTDYPIYQENHTYQTGDIVKNSGVSYRCLQGPWCSIGGLHYEPGKGIHWQQAWEKFIGSGSNDGSDTGNAGEGSGESQYPKYVDGNSYETGDIVEHNNGEVYRCLQGPWCSIGGLHYEPGKGIHWEQAWEKLIDNGGDDGSGGTNPGDGSEGGKYPKYVDGNSYETGDIIEHNDGVVYKCLQGTWCSIGGMHYEPGKGIHWEQAWKIVGSDGGDTKPDPDDKYIMTESEVAAKESELADSDLMRSVKASISTLANDQVERVVPGRSANPDNVKRVERIIDESQWNYLFPVRNSSYTYNNFLKAAAKFPAFCGNYTGAKSVKADGICKKSLATMFAHFTQETGGHTSGGLAPQNNPNTGLVKEEWRQGLYYVREMGWREDMPNGYNSECNPAIWQGQRWPCGVFDDKTDANGQPLYKSYFGRGSKQLSYNYNYGPFSEAMFTEQGEDRHTLLKKPELVADTWFNLASAVFFFIYPQPPKPSMLHVIDGTWQPNEYDKSSNLFPGFGVTTQIINGGVECGGQVEVAQSVNRQAYYKEFMRFLGLADEEQADAHKGCAGMKSFDAKGAGALPIYWEMDFGWIEGNPGGQSFACKLVNYQTPHSALMPGDYKKCLIKNFPTLEIIEG